ncbi:Glycosyltransferase involved in cell wall bisynthesis [Candidatus Electrothrix aarhusensis]|uniref:Glycosyltransferase involved in cell wall bisynthesis n=1 Tax=Candidatus Electrothrix aarhusensis TaxID=1859131 RepID=A0A3S3U7E8_9BACT|nr:Glycosyltransferase involved in cell wall bisynthesis [Candidatus Electrothrix aarhusensis]
MRIGINTLFLVPGDVGGTEIYLRRNLLAMVADNPQDVFVLFTTLDNQGLFRDELKAFVNVEYVVLPFRAAIRPVRIICEQLLLPWYVWKSKVDVLWSPGYTAPALCSCPQAVTVHDLQYKSHPDDLSFLERITLDALVRTSCHQCEAVIAVSEFSKKEILRYGCAAEKKVHAVLEGVEPDFARPVTEDEAVQLPVAGNPYILCVAHTYPHKQVHLLIDAFSRLAEKIPHHLLLVGRPRRGEAQVEESLAACPARDRVHRLASLEYTELRSLYQQADVFVLPSEYEGFGLPILEALLAGVPVVTTDKASLPEVGGDCAVYVQQSCPEGFAQAIVDVLGKTSNERAEMIDRGMIWAQEFTWKKSAARTLHILRDTAGTLCTFQG